DQPLCSSCACHHECQVFHKLAELKDAGLVVYYHNKRKKDTFVFFVLVGVTKDNAVEQADAPQAVFILHNTKDVMIKSSDIKSELESKHIPCPRCRKAFQHLQKVMQNVTSIDRKEVMGICDHCRKKVEKSKKTCSTCEEIVKVFISVKGQQKEDTKQFIKIWLSRMGFYFKEPLKIDQSLLNEKDPGDKIISKDSGEYSNVNLDPLAQKSSLPKHEPEVEQMFTSQTHKSDSELNIDINLQKRPKFGHFVNFNRPTALSEDIVVRKGHEKEAEIQVSTPSFIQSDTTFLEPCLRVDGQIKSALKEEKDPKSSEYYDDTVMDARGAIKKRHDLSLRQIIQTDKEQSSKRPQVYETPKNAPWEMNYDAKYYGKSELDVKPRSSQRDLQKSHIHGLRKHDQHKIKEDTQDFEENLRNTQKFSDENVTQIHDKNNSRHRVFKNKDGHKKSLVPKISAENVAKTQFSFFFPKIPEVEKRPLINAHSSQLIKLTQEKIRLQVEKEDTKKRLREEKKKQAKTEDKQKVLKDQRQRVSSDEKIIKHKSEGELGRSRDKKSIEGMASEEIETGKKSGTKKTKDNKAEELENIKCFVKVELEENYGIDEQPGRAKQDMKPKPEPKVRSDEISEKIKKDIKSKSEIIYETDKLSQRDKKEVVKSRQKDEIETPSEKTKQHIKSKPEENLAIGEVREKAKTEGKSKPEEKDVSDKVSEKVKKTLKSKPDNDKTEIKSKQDQKVRTEEAGVVSDKVSEKVKKSSKPRPDDDKTEIKSKQDQKVRTEEAGVVSEKVSEKFKKGSKPKPDDDKTEIKSKQDQKVRTEEAGVVSDKVGEKVKKSSKPKLDEKIKTEEADVVKKDVRSKSELTDKRSGLPDKEQTNIDPLTRKQAEKQERDEKIKREKEQKQDQERLKLLQELKKEKGLAKAQATKIAATEEKNPKEAEEPAKKKAKKGTASKKLEVIKKGSLGDVEASQKSLKAEKSLDTQNKLSKSELLRISHERQLEAKKAKADAANAAEFRKLQEQLVKERDAARKKQLEEVKAKENASRRADGERGLKRLDVNAIFGTGAKTSGIRAKRKITKTIKKRDFDVLRSVRLKPGTIQRRLSKIFDPLLMKAHRRHQKTGQICRSCILCCDSELEIQFESYLNKLKRSTKHIIIGERIYKNKQILEKPTEPKNVPILFQSGFKAEHIEAITHKDAAEDKLEAESSKKDSKSENFAFLTMSKNKKPEPIDADATKGIIRYALSERSFIDKGWTMLPTEKVVRKMNVYRMRPAHPEFDWFEHNKNKRLMTYDSGERLAEFDDNGRGRWYYRNGRLALDYYDAQETNAQQRFVIYSSGEPDERGRTHPITILATFDYLGNGIVFDHAGKIRLKYNQTEGVVLDRGIGPVSHWKWHTLNDPPVLQQVMIDTQMAHKDPEILKLGSNAETRSRPDNEEMLAIEFDNFIKEKSKKLSQKFKPFQIKMKALKINEHFSLKVLDQATIYLIYRDGSTNLKLNIGMILDHQEIVDTDTAEVGEVSNSLERFPARTDSLAGLQRSVAYAQRYERHRAERDRRLRRPEPYASVDNLTAAVAPPLRPPLLTVNGSTSGVTYCNCRKPANNLYYNTRLY
ncbi:hypothetical protein HW555_009019, partial [Spodoptera exigua]